MHPADADSGLSRVLSGTWTSGLPGMELYAKAYAEWVSGACFPTRSGPVASGPMIPFPSRQKGGFPSSK